MALIDDLLVEKIKIESFLVSSAGQKLPDNLLERLETLRTLLGEIGGGGGGGGAGLTDTQLRATAVPVTFGALPTGVNAIGSITNTSFAATQSGVWNLTNITGTVSLPTLAATSTLQSTLIGLLPASLGAKAAANSLSVTLANDGVLMTSLLNFSTYINPALAATKQSIKAATGSIYGWTITNFNTVPVYVKLFDLALASVTIGTTVPVKIIPIPAGSAANPAIFFLETQQVEQHLFATAIVVAAVTGIADASAVAPANPLYVEVRFK